MLNIERYLMAVRDSELIIRDAKEDGVLYAVEMKGGDIKKPLPFAVSLEQAGRSTVAETLKVLDRVCALYLVDRGIDASSSGYDCINEAAMRILIYDEDYIAVQCGNLLVDGERVDVFIAEHSVDNPSDNLKQEYIAFSLERALAQFTVPAEPG